MLWYNLRLRTRILLGYGPMLALVGALALFLSLRNIAFNAQIQQVNVEVTAEVTTGQQLASQVAATQQAIDRYLQQPQTDNLRTATQSLQGLDKTIASARADLASEQQHQRLDDLSAQMVLYQNSFQTLSTLLDSQAKLRNDFNQGLLDAGTTLGTTITKYLGTREPDLLILAPIVKGQQNLQAAALWSTFLVNEQTEPFGQNALDELSVVDFNLKLHRNVLNDATRSAVDDTLKNTTLAVDAVSQYMANLSQIRGLRKALLNDQGGHLKDQSDAIAAAALQRLTSATTDLEQQSRQTQLLTGAALVITLLITAVLGGLISRTITRPLMELVAATRRLNQGDYAVAVSTRDNSEVGQLATAFNQTTAALGQQRAEVLRQQAALAERNQDLEQTLAELQTTTTAREQLVQTVRMISVPVVPILKQVIMIPLVGEIDVARAQLLLERLLDAITTQRARIAILDITGVPMVDVSLVDWLIKTTSAAKLMGARCILVGIGPEVAQALVASGANIAELTTRADLRNAIEYSIQTACAEGR